MNDNLRLLLIGCGKMGGALLHGWMQRGGMVVTVIDPAPPPPNFKNVAGITWLATPEKIDPGFKPDAVVIAIKPQQMAITLPAYARFQSSIFLSIAAGQTLTHLSKLIDRQNQPLVRAMPNLPASLGLGISVAIANEYVSAQQRKLCETLLTAAGNVVWIEDEKLLDPITALSGSGPAYLFALVEAMAAAGEKLGLPPALSVQLARQTIVGSAALLAQTPESPASLRQAVTSPGGTTEAALTHLIGSNGFVDLMLKAMQAATKRSRELSE